MAEDRPPTAVFAALNDDRCRDILVETLERPLTAPELATRCGQSRSTIYRKLQKLERAGLVEDATRFRTGERNIAEYRTRVDELSVSVTTEGLSVDFGGGRTAD